jgi:hypothetical protein
MICAGIPVLRPLYRRIVHGTNTSSSNSNSSGAYSRSKGSKGSSYNLKNLSRSGDMESNRGFPDAPQNLGIRGPTTITYVTGDNHSDEEILGPVFRQSNVVGQEGVLVREHVRVQVESLGSRKVGEVV